MSNLYFKNIKFLFNKITSLKLNLITDIIFKIKNTKLTITKNNNTQKKN